MPVVLSDRKIFQHKTIFKTFHAWDGRCNQLGSFYIQEGILSRKLGPTDVRLAHLQQIVPPSLVTEVITSLHNSVTAGQLGACKAFEKIRQRYY